MSLVSMSRLRGHASLGLALLLCMGSVSAQMYKWVDAQGKTHFTDTPPPASAQPHKIKAAVNAAPALGLPYELAQAARNHPVTLYTGSQCPSCDQGRSFLRARGIPFTEKTVSGSNDMASLKDAGSAGQLPLLLVGRSKSVGFESGAWESMLASAAYPAQRMLPSTYEYPPPVAAGPAQVAPAAPPPSIAAAPRPRRTPPAPPPDKPAFQF